MEKLQTDIKEADAVGLLTVRDSTDAAYFPKSQYNRCVLRGPNLESAKIQDAAGDILQMVRDYRARINREASQYVLRYDLLERLERITRIVVHDACAGHLPQGFRCTIYIPDPLLQEHLYQLVDYYPGQAGCGRSFSERYGIIGKVWRTANDEVTGQLLNSDQLAKSDEEKLAIIARDWGMTIEEALSSLARPSYCCVLIMQSGARLGIFYMDSTEPSAFSKPNEEHVIGMLRDAIGTVKLGDVISRLIADISPISPRIKYW
ncbi:MAG: hypothetical protein ACYCUI_11715 [Vulcanimicrobiaceae bacterium]